MNGKKVLSLSIAVGVGLASSMAMALPDATKGNPLDLLGILTPDSVGDIVQDHEEPTTLHVGPAKVKEIQGTYAELGDTGPMCIDFVNVQRQAYLSPVTATQKEQAYLDRDYVSNFYQLTYSIPRANLDGLNAIKDAREEVRRAGEENQALTANYLALKNEWTDLTVTIAQLESDIEDLDSEFQDKMNALNAQNTTNTNNCILFNSTNQAAMIQCITDNITWYNTEKAKIDNWYNPAKTQLTAELATPKARKDAIAQSYYAAKGQYEAFQLELDLIMDDVSFHTLIINAQMSVSSGAWEIEKDVLAEESGKVVGRASAGYNLFDNETTALANTLAAAGMSQYTVKQLDVFNVSMNAGVTVDNITTSTDNGSTIFNKNVWSFPADTLMSNDILSDWSMPFEREDRAERIHFDTMDKNSFASGGFDFYVTKGARCGEYEQVVEETFTANTSGGVETSWKVVNRFVEPAPDQVVFAQAVGLSYNYYAYPGKLKGECTIEVDRMSSYWRNAGKKSSWSWFRKKNTSWDDTRTSAKNDMGMECTLDLVPESPDPAEAREMAEDFERAMYNDMWQMFVTLYAEEYTVEQVEPETPELEQSTVGTTLGTGLMKICPNIYCQIGGIVLKTLDSLGGSKAQGTTSSVNHEYGTIKKVYDKNSWTVKQGSSLVNVKVCVDSSQCN
ncbi:hypothetical protein [Thalassomonas haliotis]|uniref:PASTA domain-containing protein n=1 Tax=Thalassomonas haliotis TaxID=485448 RepID=A0ABY7VES1_9GAMM|nr:hypothetical protein [Thalassomonas haliotis]WDE11886.1 hypothetical protein H3N35_27480 [Thalassomonas haliotis]